MMKDLPILKSPITHESFAEKLENPVDPTNTEKSISSIGDYAVELPFPFRNFSSYYHPHPIHLSLSFLQHYEPDTAISSSY